MVRDLTILMSFLVLAAWSCSPERDDDLQLPPPPAKPEFSVAFLPGDSNRVVIQDLSAGNFQRLWNLPGGSPKTSKKVLDTIQFAKAGTYTLTLYVSKADGSGTVFSSKQIVIAKDAPLSCSPKLALLTGDCTPLGKCWTMSHEAGAVKVGPTYEDFSWYTSPVDGLQAQQYDDAFCFTFENLVFQNRNNGASVNPWNGYKPEPYDPGISEFIFQEGTGTGGRDQIIIPDDQFMGVWDADNVLDVVKLEANVLIVRARIREQNGTPKAEGWFELTFIPN